jgi:glutathione S-transferase
MAGKRISHADMTWFPTAIFMEFMLPRIFNWSPVFHETEKFPKLSAWFNHCKKEKVFADVHTEIWDFWALKEQEGQFDTIKEIINQTQNEYKWKYM